MLIRLADVTLSPRGRRDLNAALARWGLTRDYDPADGRFYIRGVRKPEAVLALVARWTTGEIVEGD